MTIGDFVPTKQNTITDEPMVLKISPSGHVAGDENNPPLIGGTLPADNSIQEGRTWLFAGTAGVTPHPQVPGTTAAGDVVGMGSLVVDLRSGYKYDLIADLDVFGSNTQEDNYVVTVDGSADAGVTWAYMYMLSHNRPVGDPDGEGSTGEYDMCTHTRGIGVTVPTGVVINRVRMQLQRMQNNANALIVYNPDTCILQINEYL
jgi:hypothetical protein